MRKSLKISFKNALAFFVMIVLLSGILSPQKAFCRDEGEKQRESLSQILRQKHPLETMEKDVHHGSLPAISYYLSSFAIYLPILPENCFAKAYADKGLDIIQHQGGLIDPSLTREGFKEWAASLTGILYFEAYFRHNHLCGAVPDLAKEKGFLKIGCHLEKDYIRDEETAETMCLTLESLTPSYHFTMLLYLE